MYDMWIIDYGLNFIDEISYLDYRQLYLKTFYISFNQQISYYFAFKQCHIVIL